MSIQQHFDDPGLRAAVRRVCPAEKAPEALRQRLSRMVSAELARSRLPTSTPVTPQPLRISFWQRPAFRMAIAATFLVGMTGLLHQFVFRDPPVSHAAVIHPQIVQAMIHTHQRCCDKPSHGMVHAPGEDFRSVGRAMEEKLQGTVLAANLAEDGWKFFGADICRVDGRSSAHLLFTRGDDWMSVFSVPGISADQVAGAGTYAQCVDGFMVAGFARDGGVYCLVGHCPERHLTLDEVAGLLKKHRHEMIPTLAMLLMDSAPETLLHEENGLAWSRFPLPH